MNQGYGYFFFRALCTGVSVVSVPNVVLLGISMAEGPGGGLTDRQTGDRDRDRGT